MRNDISEGKRLQIRRKKSHHWCILTVDDLDEANAKYSQLIIRLRAQYQAGKEPARDTHPSRNQ